MKCVSKHQYLENICAQVFLFDVAFLHVCGFALIKHHLEHMNRQQNH